MCNNARFVSPQLRRHFDRERPADTRADAARWPHIENPRALDIPETRLDSYEAALADAARQYARFRPGDRCPFRMICTQGGASIIANGAIVAPWTSAHREIDGFLQFLARGMRAVADATPGATNARSPT